MSEFSEESLEVSVVERSGLFDRDWYTGSHPALDARIDPIVHFCREGWRGGLRPNPYFDPGWYAKTYGAEFGPNENPLLHYITRGERENAWPSTHFDPEWYRDNYGLGEYESPLRHYLLHRHAGTHSPLPVFDASDYLASHPECRDSGEDLYLRWLEEPTQAAPVPSSGHSPFSAVLKLVGGNLEAEEFPEAVSWDAFRDVLRLFVPLIPFDEQWYCASYPDVAAAVRCHLLESAHQHFVQYGFFEGRSPAPRALP